MALSLQKLNLECKKVLKLLEVINFLQYFKKTLLPQTNLKSIPDKKREELH